MKPPTSQLLLPTILTVLLTPTSSNLNPYKGDTPDDPLHPSSVRRSREDDVSLAQLNDVLQQQAQTIQSLQSQAAADRNQVQSLHGALQSLAKMVDQLQDSNEDLTSQLRVLTARLNASAKAVGFSARFSSDGGGQMAGISLGYHSPLVFDDVLNNAGNAYDPHTGIFTAPLSGLYSFFLTQMTADSNDRLWLALEREGQTLDRIFTEGGTQDTHDQGASQVVTHLQAGQRVWVRQDEGDAVRGSWFTVFTGYLIQAD